jgi:predicted unusual protein kinase regulating ubiquinone biosynthesis (AarF/ABC1/UbiB family)
VKTLKSIKSSKFARGVFALKTGAKIIPKLLSKDISPEELLTSLMGKDVNQFVHEVGSLKGSFLKASQLLSSYGEYYFPKEINQVLKKVQNQSLTLSWQKINPLIPNKLKNELLIEEIPIAAASIGQVHKAFIKNSNKDVVLKIQYPGIKKAIQLDILILRNLIGLIKIIPNEINMDDIYEEIKKVLEEEMNYELEAKKQIEYSDWIKNIAGYKVPKIYLDYSDDQLIVSEYIKYPTLSELDADQLSQDLRNQIGERILYLFFSEVFKGRYIQTDCHPGNYHFDINNLELYIIDFGALIEFDEEILKHYQNVILNLYLKKKSNFFKTLKNINELNNSSFEFDEDDLWEYCQLAISPLRSDIYDWGSTDLPDQLLTKAKSMIKKIKVNKPPHQFIFLDRKLLGVFSILRKYNSKVNMQSIVAEFIKEKV